MANSLLAQAASWQQLAPEVQAGWLRLLHVTKDSFGVYTSLIQGKGFFQTGGLTPSPEAEWAALDAAFRTTGKARESLSKRRDYYCKFPARWRYYLHHTQRLEVDPALSEGMACPELDPWREALTIRSLSFVFASSHLNSPASVFGHNFIRLNLKGTRNEGPHDERSILDYGVAFQAATDPGDWLMYIVKGLSGGYTGGYLVQPYYELLNLYTFGESRDLWEVDIPLSDFEANLAVDHLWELTNFGYTPYYFTHVNCSAMLLAYLEAVKPSWTLTGHMPYFALPPRAYQLVFQAVAEAQVPHETFWPSSQLIFDDYLAGMSLRSEEQLARIVRTQTDPSEVSKPLGDVSPMVLDAALAWVNLNKSTLNLQDQTALRQLEHQLFAARLSQPPRVATEKSSVNTSPRDIHLPSALGLGVHLSEQSPGLVIRSRYGYHDLLDPGNGFKGFTQINYLRIEGVLGYQKKDRDPVQSPESREPSGGLLSWNATLIDLWSLKLWAPFNKGLSWNAAAGFQRDPFEAASIFGSGGVGWTQELVSRSSLVGFMPQTDIKIFDQDSPVKLDFAPMFFYLQILSPSAMLYARWDLGIPIGHVQKRSRPSSGEPSPAGVIAEIEPLMQVNLRWSPKLAEQQLFVDLEASHRPATSQVAKESKMTMVLSHRY